MNGAGDSKGRDCVLFGRRKRRITNILIVEDEPLVAFDTEYFLSEADYSIVATVDRVAAAMKVIDSGRAIDLVLVDVNLTDGSGVEVARHARAQNIDVLFVTGRCPAEAKELAAGCLSKPCSPRDMIAAIAAIDSVRGGSLPKRLPNGFSLFIQPDQSSQA